MVAQTWLAQKRVWLDPGLTLEPQETSDETRLAAASAGQPFLFFLPSSWSEDVGGPAQGTRHG